MTDKKNMIDDLKKFLIDELFVDLPPEEIEPDMKLGATLGVSSLGFTEIVAFLEDKYGISVSNEEFIPDNFRTINTIISLIEKKMPAK